MIQGNLQTSVTFLILNRKPSCPQMRDRSKTHMKMLLFISVRIHTKKRKRKAHARSCLNHNTNICWRSPCTWPCPKSFLSSRKQPTQQLYEELLLLCLILEMGKLRDTEVAKGLTANKGHSWDFNGVVWPQLCTLVTTALRTNAYLSQSRGRCPPISNFAKLKKSRCLWCFSESNILAIYCK